MPLNQPPPLPQIFPESIHPMNYAGFGRRFLAYTMDALPLTLLVAAFFWFFMDFDEVVSEYISDRNNIDAKTRFYSLRNTVRMVATFVLVFYGAIFESSAMQATPGKWIMGLRVVDLRGHRLGFLKALGRNALRLLGMCPAFIGVLWMLWDPARQGLHDKGAGTYVVRRPLRNSANKFDSTAANGPIR